MVERTPQKKKGILFGVTVSLLVLTVLDLVHIHLLSEHPVDSSTLLLWAALILWSLALGALLVPVVAAMSVTTDALAQELARIPSLSIRPQLTRAVAVMLLCSPVIIVVSWQLFQGRGVARYPVIAFFGPWIATVLLLLLILFAWLLRGWFEKRSRGVRRASWFMVAALILGLFFADARLFVGLYQFIHVVISLLVLWSLIVLSRTLHPDRAGSGPQTRKGRLQWLLTSLSVACMALFILVLLLRFAPQVRADLIERGLYAARGISALSRWLPLGEHHPLDIEDFTFADIEHEYLRELLAPPRSASKRPDILIFSIDAVNNDRFPGRGYSKEVMPNVAKLLPHAVRFDKAYTTVPETQYALPGLLMSTSRELGPVAAVRESGENIATALRDGGYGTYWVYEAQDLFQGGGVINNLDFEGFDGRFGIDDNRAFASSERIIQLLENQIERPIFIWTHIFAPHAPYHPPREFRRFGNSRSELYDGELLAADAYVGQVVDFLRAQGRLDSTIIVVTSDHGEWTGEGGRFGHGADVHERTVNVPLLFLGPGIEGGRVIQTPVSILDIAPTVVELGGGSIPASFEGRSLVPILRGEPFERGPLWSFTQGHGTTAVFLNDYKLVFNRNKTVVRLYNLATDREGTRDLAQVEPDRVREMMAQAATLDLVERVAEQMNRDGIPETIDSYRDRVLDDGSAEAERVLAARALGLIDSAPSNVSETLVELLRRPDLTRSLRRWLARSLAAAGAGETDNDAFELAREEEDPLVRVLLIRSLRETSRAADAVETWASAPDEHVRRAVASLVATPLEGRRPNGEASHALVTDEDETVRALSISGLSRLTLKNRDEVIAEALESRAPRVKLAAAKECGRSPRGCLDSLLMHLTKLTDTGERLSLLAAVAPALDRNPLHWAQLLEGPATQRAQAYAGLAKTQGEFDGLLLERLMVEQDDRARSALIRAVGQRRLTGARDILIRQHAEPNFALGEAATEALLRIGLEEDNVPTLLEVFPNAAQMQTKVNLLHLLGTITQINDPRVFELAERMRRTQMKDHHLIRALVEVYSRLTDPRAERFRVDHVMYTNFGYHFWLYGYSLSPERPLAGEEVRLKTVWSIRWNQPESAMHFIHLVGAERQISIDRRTVAGQPIHRWPRCRIMVDEVTFTLPSGADEIRVMTGWIRNRGQRLPVVYGEHDEERRALITKIRLSR